LFVGVQAVVDPKVERKRSVDLRARLERYRNLLYRQLESVNISLLMVDRGLTIPDVAEALGIPTPVERASRPIRPWRLRRGTNMYIIATMLEEAGRKGVSEAEMMSRLRDLGRLETADKPLRAVHWTVTELKRRTRFVQRRSRSNGARWYAYGPFTAWRNLQHEKLKLHSLDLQIRIW
jgi:hypothetical protein